MYRPDTIASSLKESPTANLRVSRFLFLAFIFLSLFLVTPDALAQNGRQSKRELEKRKKRINDEIREINQMLGQTKANKKSSMGALLSLNLKLQKRQELINTINAQIGSLEGDIRSSETQISQLQKNLQKLKEEYARMIVYSQRNQDTYTTLMFLFSAESFNQAYARLRYIQQYSEFRRKQALEIAATQEKLMQKLGELKEQRTEKADLLGHEQKEKRVLSAEKNEQEQVLTDLQKKEKELKTELERKKEDAARLQLAIRKLIEDEIRRKTEEREKARKKAEAEKARLAALKAKENEKNKKPKTRPVPEPKTPEKSEPAIPELSDEAVALSTDFANNRGKLPWPVAKGVICETYGEHEHPAIKGFMMFNNGVDICATKGSQARAVFDGEVTGIAVSPMGGNLVIIRHGEYLSVYTNLEEVLVKTGQKVGVRQAIGTVLFDEDEGKSAMNLQIWKGQKTMDPSGWLSGR
jgi:murein hydrolase activator